MNDDDDLTEEEWMLVQILANPVMFREFINEDDPEWEPLERHERAWSTCTNSHVSMCCGRSVHKTTSMIEMLYFWMINRLFIPGDPGLLVMVPNKAQKDLSFFRIRSACLTHWLIRQYAMPNAINITDGKIEFINGFQFLMRIAGAAGSDANVIGIHTARIWVDEAQVFPWQTWQSLQNCLKEEISWHQMFVSGVPNGERMENVLYFADQESPKYITFNIAQTLMSWWNPEREYRVRSEYRALHEDTEDYKHYVLGQHGVPAFNVFDRNRFRRLEYTFEKEVYTQASLDKFKDANGNIRITDAIRCPMIPHESYKNGKPPIIGLGYDPGFSPDPAAFFILYQHSPGEWRNLARILLERVEYPIQRQVLAWLDQVYHFDFIGIDLGGVGKVQYQDLTTNGNPYEQHNFAARLHPVDFGGYRVVAIDDDNNEIKDQGKRVLVEKLSQWVHEDRFYFSAQDEDLMAELERTKFTRTITGEPVYKTEDDHQMASFMCAIDAYENAYGTPIALKTQPIKVKLLAANWLMDVG